MNKTTKPDLLGVEPIDYVYRGSDGLIYRTIPQDVPVIETIPRYSAATVERLVQKRDAFYKIMMVLLRHYDPMDSTKEDRAVVNELVDMGVIHERL